jgi:hypothetical protein
MHLSQVRSTSKYVVVRVKRINAKAIAGAQVGPRIRHDLHEAHRTRR